MMKQIIPMLQSVGVYRVVAQPAGTPHRRYQIFPYATVQLHLETRGLPKPALERDRSQWKRSALPLRR